MNDKTNLPAMRQAALVAKANEARKRLLTKKEAVSQAVSGGGQAKLVFGMDATASREPTWQTAQQITGSMFAEVPDGLAVQLVYFQGLATFKTSDWLSNASAFRDRIAGVRCEMGETKIRLVLEHTLAEAQKGRVAAMVFIGDAFEEDHSKSAIHEAASQLRALGVKVFLFFEGDDRHARSEFGLIADVAGGILLPFDQNAPEQLRELLAGIAAYAKGGLPALEAAVRKRLPGARLLLTHLKGS